MMPNLLINRAAGVWGASPANSGGVRYTFQTIEGSQETAVQQLAAAMQQGRGSLVEGASEIFEIPEGETAQQVVQSLFGSTDTLTYVSRIIYGTVGDEMLIDDIEAAGEALAAAL